MTEISGEQVFHSRYVAIAAREPRKGHEWVNFAAVGYVQKTATPAITAMRAPVA
jgi:hypothetical protein